MKVKMNGIRREADDMERANNIAVFLDENLSLRCKVIMMLIYQ